jgi:hypothetical protein
MGKKHRPPLSVVEKINGPTPQAPKPLEMNLQDIRNICEAARMALAHIRGEGFKAITSSLDNVERMLAACAPSTSPKAEVPATPPALAEKA